MGARKGEVGLSNSVSLFHRCNPFDVFNPVKGRGTHGAFTPFLTSLLARTQLACKLCFPSLTFEQVEAFRSGAPDYIGSGENSPAF